VTPSEDLQALRDAIEALDHELLAFLKRRMEHVEAVAEAKLRAASPFRDPLREEEVLKRVRHTAVELDLDPHEIERLYRHILEMSVARQQAHIRSLETVPLRVAYQGVEGSYSHLTAQRRYADRAGGALLTGFDTFRAAADALRSGEADLALLPIENSTAGTVGETYDLLAEGGLTITAELVSHVEHCLLALPGTRIEELRTVISHPQALLQCDEFLRRLSGVERRAEFDTAGSARKVRERNDRTLAAIASAEAGRLFGLEVLASGIQTQAGNFTRFVEVARDAEPAPPDVPCKTSIVLVLAHRPGSLGEVLTRFGRRGVNLTRIESRPIPGQPWQYRFYLDLEGHAASAEVSAALEEIRSLTSELRVLGTYPRAEVGSAGADKK
jgi:chorismate mutase/prephenate dehydratase